MDSFYTELSYLYPEAIDLIQDYQQNDKDVFILLFILRVNYNKNVDLSQFYDCDSFVPTLPQVILIEGERRQRWHNREYGELPLDTSKLVQADQDLQKLHLAEKVINNIRNGNITAETLARMLK